MPNTVFVNPHAIRSFLYDFMSRPSITAMVTAVDQAVGAVYEEMETQGLLDNAIIVFTSDVYILAKSD